MTVLDTDIHANHHSGETSIATGVRIEADDVATTTLRLGTGRVVVDATRGVPLQFVDDADPGRRYLLTSEIPWHSVEHSWGTGYVIGDGVSGRWNAPEVVEIDDDRVVTRHVVGGGLTLDVVRRGGDVLHEIYRFRNITDRVLRIASLGVQTPFADLYAGSVDALTRRVHAHVFTGGSWAWAAAQPMNGVGRVLGLRLVEGQLWGYSVETRNANTISNARGHIVLNVTDHARNPDAFGGQPVLDLAPGEEYVLAWEVAWYDDIAALAAAARPPAEFSDFSATVGAPIRIVTALPVRVAEGVRVTATSDGVAVTAETPGVYGVRIGDDARTEVLFHDTVREAVRKRGAYVLAHQRSIERPGLLAYALVPVDTVTGLTQTTNGWSDWTDGSERIGVAVMLQHGLRRGWVDPVVDEVLEGWAAFARRHLLDDSAAPRRGSQDQHTGIRLYDSPWLAQFFLERFAYHRYYEDLDLAVRVLERAIELGIGRFLTIGFSDVMRDAAAALEGIGDHERAAALREAVVASARYFAGAGQALPAHEVSYEQSMVAPLVSLLSEAYRLTGEVFFLDAVRERLPWLMAFGAPLPHARLYGIAIRHWDGFWFGQRRQWGDVFPHYWSAMSAAVLLRLPDVLRTPASDALAEAILRANMANYFADGSATCAFVMPTSVDGVAAHAADPLANDQDFHLAIWMQLALDGLAVLA
ncbi:MAG TPA: hypothetical protein PKE40_06290 [Arachnia sp.]|nr:hypothetical protein [Arachnia sp.]HMT85946.1 hypothetical protein [Arachnia sp.]